MKTSQYIYFLIVAVIFLSIGYVWLWWTGDEVPTEDYIELPVDEPVEVPAGKKALYTDLGTIVVNDITANPLETYVDTVHVLEETSDYSILFYDTYDGFLISLNSTSSLPFSQYIAEEAFLRLVGVSQTEACKLSVDVTLPAALDFFNAQTVGLSFCAGGGVIKLDS